MPERIYGRNPVLEALESDIRIDSLLVQKGAEGSVKKIVGKARDKGIRIKYVTKRDLDCETDGAHQGVVAFIEMYRYASVDDILERALDRGEKPLIIILDGIEDPHNLGAITRTAEAAGAHGIIIPVNRSASVTETVVKTSTGAIFHIPIARVTNIAQTIDLLKEKGLWIYGLDMDGQIYWNEDLTGAAAMIIGAEGKGLSKLVKKKCDVLLSIPMTGRVSSLNASGAASVVIYDVIRQRSKYK